MDDGKREARTPNMTKCPECESDLELDGYDLDVGESVNCPECSIELKVVATDPTRVTLADAES
jgi:alpha-aminoadipate carrier protein LysW